MPKPKMLGEFLHEQQEPFSMEAYLLERGYHKDTNLNATSICHNSAKILKNSTICGIKKRRDPLPNCSNLLKLAFSQIVSVKNIKRIKNSSNGGQDNIFTGKREKRGEENAEDKSSSAFSTISMFNTCTESDVEDTNCSERDAENSCRPETYNGLSFMKSRDFLSEKQGDADKKVKRRVVDDNRQLSPVSVLEETESDDGSPIHHTQCYSNPTQGESSSSSTSQCKLKQSKRFQEMHELDISDSYYQYIINKRLLSRSKKLLVNCTREVIKNQRGKDKRREQLNKILGTDELWKLVCENVWLWSQDLIDESNIVLLLHSDFWACAEEWGDFPKQQKREISIEIGDAILDDIINDTFTS